MYSQEIKENALRHREEGVSANEVCKQLKISSSILHKWEIEKYVTVPEGLTDKQQIWNLKVRLYEAMRELEIWNQCKSSKYSSREEKLEDLKKLAPKYGVHVVCRLLDVPRCNYYYHALRSPEKKQIEIEDEKLRPIVKEIFEETKGMIGAKKIRILMKNRGIPIDVKHLSRLMDEMGLYCTTRQKVAHNTEPPKQKYYRNLIRRKFYPNAPNKVWVSDTTYLYLNYEAYYLTVILDLYSRKVIGFELVDSLEASPLIEIFKKTYAERGCPKGLIFHSDQGSAYTAYRFRVLLRGFKVKQSFSAPGEPRDNSVAESFFRNFKAELIYRFKFNNLKKLKSSIEEYVHFYNEVRPHGMLHMMTPKQKEDSYYSDLEMNEALAQ